MNKIVVYLLVGVLGAGLGYATYQLKNGDVDKVMASYMPAGGGFTLTGPEGPVSLSDYAGKPVLAYFGYTYCPDVCPTSLSVMGNAMKMLEDEGIESKGLFISFDHERDTPERLESYAPFFHPNITGVSSDEHRILEVTTRYGVYYKKVEPEEGKTDFLMDHTSKIYIINSEGKLVKMAPHGSTPVQVVDMVKAVL